ncbi:SNF5-domain-containing protein [Metschnikowia bicuspidata]|uniref:SNF5-domain-containing protein n=1 Tax=Metschnikowia bicuspidata TaxID=27322 RepID=A0A4P9ZCK7_9ASCO|nr:SNF5-domain-containing protein [Metschnikowia bicuspidata]
MKNGHQQSATPTGFVKEKIKIPPHFAPDVLQNINLTPLSSLTEWSQELAKENKPVPLDVKLYEDIIKKDDFYLRKMLSQTQSSKKLIDRMARDIQSYSTVKQLRMAAINAAAKNQYSNSIWGEGYSGYGNGVTNSATRVVMPSQNKCFSKPGQMTMTDAELNKQVLENIASNPSKRIVPIRLEFDLERDRFKLRDTFLWDLNDTTYPIEAFLRNLIDDYSFITDINFQMVLRSVNEQIKEYKEKPLNAIGEIRIPIKIDLLINNTQYTDKFEWDILSDKDDDPEEFASILCDELSLPGEFATAIAFSIREKSQMYIKALSLVGYSFDGSHIREDEVRSNMASPLRIQNPDSGHNDDFITMLRTPSLVGDYSPSITRISQLEIEKIDKELDRDSRRRRRHNDGFSYNENGPNLFGTMFRGTASRRSANHSGRGTKTTLPDLSDVPKTFRTPFPSSVLPGGIDVGTPEIFTYNELVINRSQVANPDFKPAAPPGMVTIFKDSAGSFFMKIKSRKLLQQ